MIGWIERKKRAREEALSALIGAASMVKTDAPGNHVIFSPFAARQIKHDG